MKKCVLMLHISLFIANKLKQHFFLLIIEPQSGFRIAFNMFDTDGNQIVDKKEFLVVSIELFQIITKKSSVHKIFISKLA